MESGGSDLAFAEAARW